MTGTLGRLGGWTHRHRLTVVASWVAIAVTLGVFAPRLEHALSGAMWEVRGSDSLSARQIIDREFGGVSSQSAAVVFRSDALTATDPEFASRITAAAAVLRSEPAFANPLPPQVSPDGHTVLLTAGTLVDPTEAVRAAQRISPAVQALDDNGVRVALTGAPAFWSDFNAVNKEGMMRAELFTWPVTALILVVAFGSLAAAGLPLLLTAAGLVTAMGVLYGVTRIADLSVWTLNFAMMFALALGIDYALFIVTRFRAALREVHDTSRAVAIAMDTAGKAVFFSGLIVLISLSGVLLVPIPAFQSMAVGMMLAVGFVLLAAITLLPALLGPGVDRFSVPWRSRSAAGGSSWDRLTAVLQRRPWLIGTAVTGLLLVTAAPLLGLETGMPGISVLPKNEPARAGYAAIAAAFGPGAPGPLQVIVPAGADAGRVEAALKADPGIASVLPAQAGGSGYRLITAFATSDPSTPEAGRTVARLRAELPADVLVGGAVAENHDLDQTLRDRALLVIGTVKGLGFVILLFALRGLVIALLGVGLNLLSVAAAFGIGALAFQHGWAAGPMGFESQGYLTSWAPLFFFTLVFAVSMDYTVFLLSAAREHFERHGDAQEAVRAAISETARPIVAAAGVMVAVFFTFALAGPLPMKEMGLILGVSVLIDAFIVRIFLLPAFLSLVGHRGWWLPTWADRLLPDIRFAH